MANLCELDDLWIEDVEGFAEGVVVGSEVFFGSYEWAQEFSARANASEGEGEAVDGAIGAEPVFGLHPWHQGFEFGGEPVGASIQNAMHFGDEKIEWSVRILVPMMCEKVVEENVDNDAGEAPSFG